MEISYWQSRWRKRNTGWHMKKVYSPLKKYWSRLRLQAGQTVLVPLCGKSLDIDWLTRQGYYVVAVDVSERALKEVMHRVSFSFEESVRGSFTKYMSPSLQLWCGDFFKLKKNWLPTIHAIYDKAALIALPPRRRTEYVALVKSLMHPETQIFLNCFEYDQSEMNGPPFAVFENEVRTKYGSNFAIHVLQKHAIFDDLPHFRRRGLQSYLTEKIYHIAPHSLIEVSNNTHNHQK